MEPLPTRSNGEPPLQNVLSISTAGKNRYLLHFNSHHSLIQWTAGIRLAMYEYTTLQEAYTGALIAGKGKALNNINLIMERSKFKHEEWVRVRFGAGTPWRRCWCVISPPDEKEFQKLQKEMKSKKSKYDRSKPPVLKGDIKFYDNKKTKKQKPLAQITNAYSAFAIYPQSKPLIDASTLIKIEGKITIHSDPPNATEGFVFVMPEVHAAVSGFEMMLRWLFPAWDTFALYGRPSRLIADTLDPRSLMFAMPKERRYGYLEILDVTNLILEPDSPTWTEMEWRRRMKEVTQRRMTAISSGSRAGSRYNSRRNTMRNSVGPSGSRSRVGFDDGASVRSTPDGWGQGPPPSVPFGGVPRTDSAPVPSTQAGPSGYPSHQHHRSISESQGLDRYPDQNPTGNDGAYESGPPPPPHAIGYASTPQHGGPEHLYSRDMMEAPERLSGEDELAPGRSTPVRELQDLQSMNTPEPVAIPPGFSHAPGTLPASKPYHSPELRKANIRMSHATLSQMTSSGAAAAAGGAVGIAGQRLSEDRRRPRTGDRPDTGEKDPRGVQYDATNNSRGMTANPNSLTEDAIAARHSRNSSENRPLPPPPFDDSYSNSAYNSQQYQVPGGPSNMASRLPFDQTRSGHQPHLSSGSSAPGSSHSNRAFPPVAPIGAPSSSYEQIQGHGHSSSTDSTRELSRLQTSQSILRKPLPASSMKVQEAAVTPEPQTSSSLGSLGNFIDQTAFNSIKVPPHFQNPPPQGRSQDNLASLNEDSLSTASPDYASTIQSGPRESFEKPRAGVLRTVGGDPQQPPTQSNDIPNIDFGPTINYAANRAPRESSPARRSPVRTQQAPLPQAPATNRARATPEPGQYRPEPNAGARQVAWRPGMAASGTNSPSRVISAEQYVQERASMPSQYAHQRQQSSVNSMRTGTPPLGGKNSYVISLYSQGHIS
jgi:CCR4-NOT transcriptional complex subunit CAF120